MKKILLTVAAVMLAAAMIAAETPAPKAVKGTVYSWNPAGYTYHQIGGSNRSSTAVWEELKSYKPVKDGVPEKNPEELLGFLVVLSDGSKENYYLTKTQLRSKERGVLDATPQQCRVLHVMAKANNQSQRANPQWLRYMSTSRLTEVKFSGNALDDTMTDISFTTTNPAQMANMGRMLQNLYVKCSDGTEPESSSPQPDTFVKFENGSGPNPSTGTDAITMKLTFDTGVVYDIWLYEQELYVFSSDMSYSLGYALSNEQAADSVRRRAEGMYYELHPQLTLPDYLKPNPDTGKPVIYRQGAVAQDMKIGDI